jgi:hypothetical protein
MGMNALVKKVLTEVGINPDRFDLQWASAAEAPRFVNLITDFTAKVKKLGPLGESEGIKPEDLQGKIAKAQALINDKKLRVGFGNVTKAMRKEGNKITPEWIAELVDSKLSKTIDSALAS